MITSSELESLTEQQLKILAYGLSQDNIFDYTENPQFLKAVRKEKLGEIVNKISRILKPEFQPELEEIFNKLTKPCQVEVKPSA